MSVDELDIYVHADGTVQAIYSDELAPLLDGGETRRASHVEPCGNGWTADMAPVGGPVLGPFTTRAAALQAEVDWLRERLALGKVSIEGGGR